MHPSLWQIVFPMILTIYSCVGGLNEEEIATYKSYFINALEMVKDDPNITEFCLATINYNQHEPILRIFGNTKNPLAPVKPFEFRVEDNNKVLRIK